MVLFSNSIADSPLLQVPGGTKKTERRRSRSRNRQEIESELARKLNEIPMVHDTIEYLLSSYSLIKVFNQINFYYVRWETERIWWWFGTNVVCQTFFFLKLWYHLITLERNLVSREKPKRFFRFPNSSLIEKYSKPITK